MLIGLTIMKYLRLLCWFYRINRKWMIESIEDEGGKSVIKNPILAH